MKSRSYIVLVTKTVTTTQQIYVDRAKGKKDAREQAADIAADNGDAHGATKYNVTTKVIA